MPRRRGGAGDSGSATVEFAVVLPAFMGVLAVGFSALSWGLRVEAAQRGAAEAARAAITESRAEAAAVGTVVAGTRVTVSASGGYVTACATVRSAPWPPVTRCATAREAP